MKAPRLEYTAWPKDSMPVWPSSMLYDSAKMIMIPICDSSVMAKPPGNSSGSTAISSAVTPQRIQRACSGAIAHGTAGPAGSRGCCIVDSMAQPPGTHQAARAHDEHQHQQYIGSTGATCDTVSFHSE